MLMTSLRSFTRDTKTMCYLMKESILGSEVFRHLEEFIGKRALWRYSIKISKLLTRILQLFQDKKDEIEENHDDFQYKTIFNMLPEKAIKKLKQKQTQKTIKS